MSLPERYKKSGKKVGRVSAPTENSTLNPKTRNGGFQVVKKDYLIVAVIAIIISVVFYKTLGNILVEFTSRTIELMRQSAELL